MARTNAEGIMVMGGQTSKIVLLMGQEPKKQGKKTHELLVVAFRPAKPPPAQK